MNYSEFICALAEEALAELLERGGKRIRRADMRIARRATEPTVFRVLAALRDEGAPVTYQHHIGPRGAPTTPGGWACEAGAELPEELKTRARLVSELRATRQLNYSYGRLIEALCHGGDPPGAVAYLADADDLEQHLVAAALARVATGRALPVFVAMAGGAL